jgi:hypothetical protein
VEHRRLAIPEHRCSSPLASPCRCARRPAPPPSNGPARPPSSDRVPGHPRRPAFILVSAGHNGPVCLTPPVRFGHDPSADHARGGTQITPTWCWTPPTGKAAGAAPNGSARVFPDFPYSGRCRCRRGPMLTVDLRWGDWPGVAAGEVPVDAANESAGPAAGFHLAWRALHAATRVPSGSSRVSGYGPAIAAERASVAGGLVQPHGRDRSTATSGNSSGEP